MTISEHEQRASELYTDFLSDRSLTRYLSPATAGMAVRQATFECSRFSSRAAIIALSPSNLKRLASGAPPRKGVCADLPSITVIQDKRCPWRVRVADANNMDLLDSGLSDGPIAVQVQFHHSPGRPDDGMWNIMPEQPAEIASYDRSILLEMPRVAVSAPKLGIDIGLARDVGAASDAIWAIATFTQRSASDNAAGDLAATWAGKRSQTRLMEMTEASVMKMALGFANELRETMPPIEHQMDTTSQKVFSF